MVKTGVADAQKSRFEFQKGMTGVSRKQTF
jgi:hypothetical protein